MNTATFGALAEPHRLGMVELLREGPLSVGDIAERLAMGQPQASKHLRVLSDAGLVESQPAANKRMYKLRQEPLQEIDEWLSAFRTSWEARLDRLDALLAEMQSKGKPKEKM
ncbi:ArsR/SmtB family transcription factor [Cohnella hashimotonis]|uniref:Metalloregulator ArsR/SmtB family transcription factor n=1 Tax=Cohnella hashimotonis TaxID=2826895 RepID=A0ABT6TAP4_9BACL|nr:metalloregulator ArsR/SmtB family transcription factor [Cohnella hashimotonis]MDI4643909.1 metalloregulator ArsR/SmtB family transcription factor [Cohnella hashimotonis]